MLWGGVALRDLRGDLLGPLAAWARIRTGRAPATRVNDGSVAAIGKALLTTYSLAFELISLALLVAIIGALAIARTAASGISTKPDPEHAAVGLPLRAVTGAASSAAKV